MTGPAQSHGAPARPGVIEAGIADAAAALALPLTPPQIASLAGFVELLGRWNHTYNLTAVREPLEMVSHHIADCLAAVRPLRRQLPPRATVRLLDVGSGAGLPGIVLALCNPEWFVTCIDSVGKKTAFVRQATAQLGLTNVQSVQARVESLAPAAGYDAIVSRAFASMPEFIAATRSQLAPDGIWMAMKGQLPEAEIHALPAFGIQMFHVEHVQVPNLVAARCLIFMRSKR